MSKINEAMAGIERSFAKQERRLDRLEFGVFGLYVLTIVFFVAVGAVYVIL